MRSFAMLLAAVVLVTPAMAFMPAPYIGANLQVNSPTGNFSETDIANDEGGAKTGLGGEVDVGITVGGGSVYLGYRFGKHDADAKYDVGGEIIETSGEWSINRWVLGGRLHILGNTPLPVVPTVGGGVTMGKTDVSAKGSVGENSIDRTETSDNAFGWFLELGALLKPPGPLSLIGNVQYHSFDADYQSQLYDGKVNVAFFTFQIGARLALGPTA